MNINRLFELSAETLRATAASGFDHVAAAATAQRLVGVRIAHGIVCRENVDRVQTGLRVVGGWQRRKSSFECAAGDTATLPARATALRRELELLTPDKEWVPPSALRGRMSWELASGSFNDVYGPAALYPIIERAVAPLRREGLRVTGYVEAQQRAVATCTTGGLALTTSGDGATVTITVDDPATGASGAAVRAALDETPAGFEALLSSALAEARTTCRAGAATAELEPGDYTVVLHPAAFADIVQSALGYGLCDRRKIDEGRTYLSKHRDELRFPAGLRLAQTLALPLANGVTYADLPLNYRLAPCGSLEFVTDGRLRDLHCSAYWAQQAGQAETFSLYDGPPLLLAARPGDVLAQGHDSIRDLIAATERGVYVANVWYLRMVAEMDGMLTGMTRDGIFEIRDGRLVRPVRHMRWHDNPFRILSAVSGLSRERLLVGGARLAGDSRRPLAAMPAARVEKFHFSSVTKF